MKIKVKDLIPNPFKKTINKGKLSQTQIDIIKSNIEELGLMGSLPVFKKHDKYFLIAGHHRTEALRQAFGEDYKVEVTVHHYTADQILRGMVIENLTQRADDLMEVTENLASVREYLKNVIRSDAERNKKGRWGEGRPDEPGSLSHIQIWLNQNGEIMSKGKISQYLKVYDNLDRRLLVKTIKVEGGNNNENILSVEEAKSLARVDKKDQIKMLKLLKNTGLDYKRNAKLITLYKRCDDEVKTKVLKGEIKLEELDSKALYKDILGDNVSEPTVRNMIEWIDQIYTDMVRTSKLLDIDMLELCNKDELNELKSHFKVIFEDYYNPFLDRLKQLSDGKKIKNNKRLK